MPDANPNCPKCKGTGRIKTKEGISVCYDCLLSGEMDQHDKNLRTPDVSKLKV